MRSVLAAFRPRATLLMAQRCHKLVNGTNLAPSMVQRRFPGLIAPNRLATVKAGSLRAGNVVVKNGRTLQVVTAKSSSQGRQGATVHIEYRDVRTDGKVFDTLKPGMTVETSNVENRKYTFLYDEGDTLTFMDPTTFEQVEIQRDLIGPKSAYLNEGVEVSIETLESGEPVGVKLPQKADCEVQEVSGGGDSGRSKAVLKNGRTVAVPAYVKVGDVISVLVAEDKFDTRR
mmetsp:Transcript_25234/g.59523  ORF Transcript_25234/g.59523 Transcript_25234/m.59523 type:complete len:230 (+) Transcript_25234:14-703(+)|eukprot:CAMPEP_0175851150 /NCGR_PEP_ID=MMETSP0107_2-20121207/25493_1 /TAXON_ID=195067 ORGANISM="Goniomonas pacifica, Strain CCMP1869" /NCGR_SAMPLE_ID=MMETSP0107_2 /ASSEMBLY_ACC=CAM_ASM_000203 /LENGTH=229 /DNA_ID=CAMNT_0017166533 /DNA_START=88 /DNA_END=777 /DNA_ORIENTATION=-